MGSYPGRRMWKWESISERIKWGVGGARGEVLYVSETSIVIWLELRVYEGQ